MSAPEGYFTIIRDEEDFDRCTSDENPVEVC